MDFSGVVRQQLRGEVVIRYTGLLLFGLKCGHVVKRQCTDSHGFLPFLRRADPRCGQKR